MPTSKAHELVLFRIPKGMFLDFPDNERVKERGNYDLERIIYDHAYAEGHETCSCPQNQLSVIVLLEWEFHVSIAMVDAQVMGKSRPTGSALWYLTPSLALP